VGLYCKSPELPPQRCDLGLGLPVHSYCITILKNKFNYSSYHLYSLTHLFTLSTRFHPVYSVTLFTHIHTCHSYITFHSLTPLALSYFHTLSHNYSFFLTNSMLHIMSLFSPILSNSYIPILTLLTHSSSQAPPTRWTWCVRPSGIEPIPGRPQPSQLPGRTRVIRTVWGRSSGPQWVTLIMCTGIDAWFALVHQ